MKLLKNLLFILLNKIKPFQINHVKEENKTNKYKTMSNTIKLKNAKLTNAITKLLLSDNLIKLRYFGHFCSMLTFKEDYSIDTAAVTFRKNGVHFLYNPHFIDSLMEDEIIYLIYHEVSHIHSKHLLRNFGFTRPEDFRKSNVVQDAIINYFIQKTYSKESNTIDGGKSFLVHLIRNGNRLSEIELDYNILNSKIELGLIDNSKKEKALKKIELMKEFIAILENDDTIEIEKIVIKPSVDDIKAELFIDGKNENEILAEMNIKHGILFENIEHLIQFLIDNTNLNPYSNHLFISNSKYAGSGIHIEPFIESGFDLGADECNLFFEKLFVFYNEKIKELQTKADTIGYDNLKKLIHKENKTYTTHIKSHNTTPYNETMLYTGNMDLYAFMFVTDKNNKGNDCGYNLMFDDYVSDDSELTPDDINSMIKNIDHNIKSRGGNTDGLNELINRIVPQKENYLKKILSLIKNVKGNASITKTYRKMNKKNEGDTIFKGKMYNSKKLSILCDYSGSMHGLVEPILGFCIKDNYEGDLVMCDTKITKEDIFKLKKPSDIKKIKGFTDCYGGTELKPGVDFILKEYGNENILILTDGYCDELDLGRFKKALIISVGIEVNVYNKPSYFRQIVVNPKDIINI